MANPLDNLACTAIWLTLEFYMMHIHGSFAVTVHLAHCIVKLLFFNGLQWYCLQGKVKKHANVLVFLYFCSVQDFHQMCDETRSWIGEKDQALSTDDCGRDLASVQALQRRHQVGRCLCMCVCEHGVVHDNCLGQCSLY